MSLVYNTCIKNKAYNTYKHVTINSDSNVCKRVLLCVNIKDSFIRVEM